MTIQFWPNGEQIPDAHIERVYRQPPGVPVSLTQSTILVGPRGVGKTTYLRYQAAQHKGLHIFLRLEVELSVLGRDDGHGLLRRDVWDDEAPNISGKAASLIPVSLAYGALEHHLDFSIRLFNECLPENCRGSGSPFISSETLAQLRRTVQAEPPSSFRGLGESGDLGRFVADLGVQAIRRDTPLLLLFDKADQIHGHALSALLPLLDQPGEYLLAIAMRPGQSHATFVRFSQLVTSHDHYRVLQLGRDPRSSRWKGFVGDAVESQLKRGFSTIPESIRAGVLTLAGPSVRTALEAFKEYLDASPSAEGALEDSLRERQREVLHATSELVRRYGFDTASIVATWRSQLTSRYGSITRPVLIEITGGNSQRLSALDPLTLVERVLLFALREGALLPPGDGGSWGPGTPLTRFEVSPLLLWKPGDPLWYVGEESEYLVLPMKQNEVLDTPWHTPAPVRIFVAYTENDPHSAEFRKRVERVLRGAVEFTEVEITDGMRENSVRDYSDSIRRKIASARFVLADITEVRAEIVFEHGYAYGQRRTTVSFVRHPEDLDALPDWLAKGQVHVYGRTAGLTQLPGIL